MEYKGWNLEAYQQIRGINIPLSVWNVVATRDEGSITRKFNREAQTREQAIARAKREVDRLSNN